MDKLNHFDHHGQAHMVDVGHKSVTHRSATARGKIIMNPDTFAKVAEGSQAKGDVLGIARIAAIMASKKTADLIPLCHPLALTKVSIEFEMGHSDSTVTCLATAETSAQTGVEMEALTAVQVALLTIYDMCKAMDKSMVMTDIALLEKIGGKSGHWKREV